MKKSLILILLSMMFLLALVPAVQAEDPGVKKIATDSQLSVNGMLAIAAAVAVTIAAFGCGIGQGIATSKAVEGIARNPGASGKITTPLVIGLAMIESLTIYGFVIAIMLILKWY